MKIIEEALNLVRNGRSCAVATIVQCSGSAPQKTGAKMLIRDDGSTVGTLGGGCLEAEVIQMASTVIKDGRPQAMPVELTERSGGLVCGGRVLVFIEPMTPDPHLVILGAGHVGKALVQAARFAGFRVTVMDDREDSLQGTVFVGASSEHVALFRESFAERVADRNTYIVIATRGHLHDYEALQASLGTEAGYIGLLGSRRKKALLFKRLREDGYSEEMVQRVITPVGLAIGAASPEEIAISIVAQLIEKRRMQDAPGPGHSCGSGVVHADGLLETTPPD